MTKRVQWSTQKVCNLLIFTACREHLASGGYFTQMQFGCWKHVIKNSYLFPCRSAASKVYPAMYIGNITELAFDDVTPEDPDFSSIQGDNGLNFLSSMMILERSYCLCPLFCCSRVFSLSWIFQAWQRLGLSQASYQDVICFLQMKKTNLPFISLLKGDNRSAFNEPLLNFIQVCPLLMKYPIYFLISCAYLGRVLNFWIGIFGQLWIFV